MGITRTQYVSPPPVAEDGSPVLVGQVQGVKVDLMSGIIILPDGTLRIAPEQVNYFVRTNNELAFNDYIWPDPPGPPNNSGVVAQVDGSGITTLDWWAIGQDNGSGNPIIGTVFSVDINPGTTGLTFTGGPVTTTGTITVGGILAVVHGGTGADNPSDARDNLGAGTVREVTAGPGLETNPFAGITVRGSVFIPDQPAVTPGTYLIPTVTVDSRGIITDIENGTPFPTDTVMLFQNAVSPPGWTKLTALNNIAIRLVNGNTGGQSGGTADFTTSFAAYTPQGNVTVSGSTGGGRTGATNLQIQHMPVHSHGVNDPGHSHGVNDPGHNHVLLDQGGPQTRDNNNISSAAVFKNRNYPTSHNQTGIGIAGNTTGITIRSEGGGNGHDHGLPGVSLTAFGTLSGTTTTQFQVRYVDVIAARKD